MDRASADNLIRRVDALIAQARDLPPGDNMGAVNWGDISARDVIKEESLTEEWSDYYVIVEEASPTCRLAEWLTEKLDEPGVSVRTEW